MKAFAALATPPQKRFSPTPMDGSASDTDRVTINGAMTVTEILKHLAKHKCENVTGKLDVRGSSRIPVSSGGFGDVYVGYLHSGNRVGIKCLRLMIGSDNQGRKQLRRAAHELYIWSKCNHPNVLSLIGVAEYQGRIAMISDWMENGNLNWFLPRHPEVNRGSMCLQIADGVAYLHKEGVVHGDIKSLNILVSSDYTPKITDFGNSVVNDYTLKFAATTSGPNSTLRWTPPEILAGTTKHTKEGDIYSLGMTILEILTGSEPYHGTLDIAVMVQIIKGQHPLRPEEYLPIGDNLADRIWTLLTGCWSQNARDRPSSTHIRDELKSVTEYKIWQSTPTVIHNTMSVDEVLGHLCNYGCVDVTDELDGRESVKVPVSNGKFGRVYSAKFRDGSRVGLKVVGVAIGMNDDGKSYIKASRAAHELYVWSKCKHQSVLELLGVAQHQGRLVMVSPWMENGNLVQFIAENSMVDRHVACSHISDAVAYLHSEDIVHGDIKGSNVLVSHDHMIKLADFGNGALSEYELKFANTTATQASLISRRWAAPEMMNGSKPSFEGDVYALGMTILEVITGLEPYAGFDEYTACSMIIYGKHPARPESQIPNGDQYGDMLWSTLQSCWEFSPEDRPCAIDVRDEMLRINLQRPGLTKVR